MRRADKTDIERFTDEDGDWIDVRTQLSVEERDAVVEAQQSIQLRNDDETTELRSRIHLARRTLFDILVVGWSLTEADGAAIACSADEYSALDSESGGFVDSSIDEALEGRKKRAEGKSRSSKRRAASASKPRKARASA